MVKIHPWEVESFKKKEMEMRGKMGGKKEGKARGSTRVGGVRKIYKRKSKKNSLISNSLCEKKGKRMKATEDKDYRRKRRRAFST